MSNFCTSCSEVMSKRWKMVSTVPDGSSATVIPSMCMHLKFRPWKTAPSSSGYSAFFSSQATKDVPNAGISR